VHLKKKKVRSTRRRRGFQLRKKGKDPNSGARGRRGIELTEEENKLVLFRVKRDWRRVQSRKEERNGKKEKSEGGGTGE